MKIFKFLIPIFSIVLFSCSSLKNKTLDENTAYQKFRNQQENFVSADGNIKYIDSGKGDEVILLLHGVPSSGWLYRKMITELTSKGYRVIAPDMLGYGNSDNPDGYDIYNEQHHASRIIALMDHLKIKNWHHVMHDAGGLWTWEIFKQQPNRIRKISVLNTIVFEEGFHPPVRMKKNGFAKFSMWLYKNGVTTNMMLKMLYKNTLNDPKQLSNEDKLGYKKPLIEGKTKGMYYFFTQTCNDFPSIDSVTENLSIPVQIIWGKNDEMLQLKPQLTNIKKHWKIEDANIHWIDGTHFIQEEKPTEVANFIVAFENQH